MRDDTITRAVTLCVVGLVASTVLAADTTDPTPASSNTLAALSARIAALEAEQQAPDTSGGWPGFEFHGYMRSGFGTDGQGGPMEAFKAPGAAAKYRLGNEAETYLETAFRQNLVPRVGDTDFAMQVRMAYVIPSSHNNTYDATITLPEAFAEASGVIAGDPGAGFWAGQRFYDRRDIHMNDFFYRDLTGFGGGVEDVSVGGGKMAFAWIGGTISELRSNGLPYEEPNAVLNKNTFDLRWYDLSLPGGSLATSLSATLFDGDSYIPEGETESVTVTDDSGWACGLYHTLQGKGPWHNRIAAQYGTGSAANFRSTISAPANLDIAGGDVISVSEFTRFLVIEDLVLDTEGPWALALAAVYSHSDLGQGGDDTLEWLSFGVRPTYFFTEHYSLAFEAGWDHTDTEGGADGSLWKFTLAPQITPTSSLLSRPSLRAFVTYAFWSDSFRGAVAPDSYGDETEGMSAGVQMETWW